MWKSVNCIICLWQKLILICLILHHKQMRTYCTTTTTLDDIASPPLSDTNEITKFDESKKASLSITTTKITTATKTPTLSLRPSNTDGSNVRRLPPPPRIRLNKCCMYGQYLDNDKLCIAGSSEKWIPLIYLIQKKSHHVPHGTAPKFITFEDNTFPIERAHNKNNSNNMNSNSNLMDQVHCTLEELDLFTGTNNIVIFSNGSLFLPELSILVPPKHYCVDQHAALVCFTKSNATSGSYIKLKKCCGPHGVYDSTIKKCYFNDINSKSIKFILNNLTNYRMTYGFPACKNDSDKYAIAGDWMRSKFDMSTGYLYLPQHKINLSTNGYCLEYIRGVDMIFEKIKVFTCLQQFERDIYLSADDITNSNNSSSHLQLAMLHTAIIVSVIFLGVTLIASYLIPSVHHVLHWRCQMYYVSCLFFGDLLLALTQLTPTLTINASWCLLIASCMHFCFLAAFFWLNTMCFNIWWTFRDFRPMSLERNQEILRLRLYCAYAWGLPILITSIAACVNLMPELSLLRPGFGERVCWFNGDHLSIFAYFFGPIGILLSINIILFISTTHQLTCGLWKRDDVKSTTEKTALGKVCLKLIIVMGVTWIADVLSWMIGGPHWAWFFTDIINALQGVFIFIVIGCQPQVLAGCKRYCFPRSRQEITNTTNGVQHSSSSQGTPSVGNCNVDMQQNVSVATTPNLNESEPNIIQQAANLAIKIPMETVC